MNKKSWLDKVYYDIGKQQDDFFVAGTYKKNGEIGFSKWKKFSDAVFPIDFDGTCEEWKKQKFFEQINQRQILSHEVVLDLEERDSMSGIVKDLKKKKIEFSVWDTGSKGYHIHMFYDKELKEEEKLAIIKYYKADEMKSGPKVLIALESEKHWKSGKIKKEIKI